MDDKLITWLTKKLNEKGWSHRELARRAGVSGGMVSAVVAGNKKAGWDFCEAIAGPLGISPEDVFRLAGLLPPLPSSGDGPILEEIIGVVKRLEEDEKQDVLDYAKLRYEKQQGKKKPKPITLTVPAPKPVIEHAPSIPIPRDIPPETVAKVRAMMERLTPTERAKLIEHLLARRDFVEALKLRGIEIPPQHRRQAQKASNRKDQE